MWHHFLSYSFLCNLQLRKQKVLNQMNEGECCGPMDVEDSGCLFQLAVSKIQQCVLLCIVIKHLRPHNPNTHLCYSLYV